MDIRSSVIKMVNSVTGTWPVAAAYLGMTEIALKNRVYESKGQALRTRDAMRLQELSQTTLFAEAVAHESGCTLVELPDVGNINNENVQKIFNESYAELGMIFAAFCKAIEDDGVIDTLERRKIEELGIEMHRKVERLQAVMFSTYCRKTRSVVLASSKAEAEAEVAHV